MGEREFLCRTSVFQHNKLPFTARNEPQVTGNRCLVDYQKHTSTSERAFAFYVFIIFCVNNYFLESKPECKNRTKRFFTAEKKSIRKRPEILCF